MRGIEGRDFRVGEAVVRAAAAQTYDRKPDDPVARPLRIFTLDPGASLLEGSVATLDVPYEPVERTTAPPRLRGAAFEVDPHDAGTGVTYDTLDLDARHLLLQSGRDPSPDDPLFHQQMVYAVCATVYASFRRALGRVPTWAFKAEHPRLVLRPYGSTQPNAWYDDEAGALVFGYFEADDRAKGRTPPGGLVFTSLAHDIVTHEVTHALLGGLRADFLRPSNPDVPAFHEAFADLMAIFHRFSYPEVVRVQMARTRGRVSAAGLLAEIARQFGQARGGDHGIRTPIEGPDTERPLRYDPTREAHELGIVLVSAVFDAFAKIVDRKTARYVRLATGGTGVLLPGEIPAELCAILASEASKVARQFLEICIRAIDYCPPVDMTFGEYLRAVITADQQLVTEDPWRYREAWIDSFRIRGIFPKGVRFLSESALAWCRPEPPIPPIEQLTFTELRFDGDPARPASADALRAQARALGEVVSVPANAESVGLALPGDRRLGDDEIELPTIQSIRTARRAGPDGQVVFDLVAEVTQARRVARGGVTYDFLGGSTIIIGPDGRVRYVVSKSVLNEERLERQTTFMQSDAARALWQLEGGRLAPKPGMLRALHETASRR